MATITEDRQASDQCDLEVTRLIAPTASEVSRARHRLHRKSLVIAALGLSSYWALIVVDAGVVAKLFFAAVLVIAATAAATSVMHDGNHGSFSTSKTVNRIAGFAGDMLGASSWIWKFKHNHLHHGNTNVVGFDADIEQAPFARLAPSQQWRPWHRYQHVYMWILYGFLTVQWFLFSDFIDLAKRGIGAHQFPRPPRRRDIAGITAGKVVHASWAIGLPLIYHRWWVVLTFYLACSWLVGLLLATMFQLAHCVELAEFATPDTPRRGNDFVRHQLRTTVDVHCRTALGRRSLTWIMGGLNYQTEHHLAPRLPHTVYPLVASRLHTVCEERHLAQRNFASPWQAIRAHGHWLKMMGRQPVDHGAPMA